MDVIEREVMVAAEPERVWAVLTEARHLAEWFAIDGAELELKPGGRMVLRWKEHGEFRGVVERVEPPRVFSFRWALMAGEEPVAGNSTVVEFTLRREAGGTGVRVVERGFEGLTGIARERAVQENVRGWEDAFRSLERYVGAVVV
jgi:uncharacterized protein YndB with AHSA1/START domain